MNQIIVDPVKLQEDCHKLIQAARQKLRDPQAKLILVIPDYQYKALRLYWMQYPKEALAIRGTTDPCRCQDSFAGCNIRTSRVLDQPVVY